MPEKLAVGAAAHRRCVSKVTGRDGKFSGLLAFAVTFLSMAAAAMLAIGLFPGGDCVCG
ncbi:MAG TPA: hypothetical protein VN846_04325 [Candidatus Cybelea sp.]|nr:hypothetical protein [Candidatus Cybelea sp.]